MNHQLSEQLLSRAFRASNGELAWKKEDLVDVLDAYVALGLPVEAYEVWLVNEKGQWTGILPTTDSVGSAVCVFDVEKKKANESDKDFVTRTKKEILDSVARVKIEDSLKPEYIPFIRYNLYVEKEYID